MTAGPRGAVNSMLMYLIGLLLSYLMSYFITNAVITDNEVAEALGGISTEPVEARSGECVKTDEEIVNCLYRTVSHGESVAFGFEALRTFEHLIKDPVGIHARPAGELAKLVSELGCEVTVKNGEKTANGKSVIELMMLGASQNSRLEVTVSGANAGNAAKSLKQFMDERL